MHRWPALIIRRSRDADCRRIEVCLHGKLARRVAIARRIPGSILLHIYGHCSRGRRRDGGCVAGPRTGEGRHRTVADRHIALLERPPFIRRSGDADTHRFRKLDSQVERTVLIIRRPGDGHCRCIQVCRHRELARRLVGAVECECVGDVCWHIYGYSSTGRWPDGGCVAGPRTGEGRHRTVALLHHPSRTTTSPDTNPWTENEKVIVTSNGWFPIVYDGPLMLTVTGEKI